MSYYRDAVLLDNPIAFYNVAEFVSEAMMIVVNTAADGATETVTLPLGGTVDCYVDWGDGHIEHFTSSGSKTHTYESEGIYSIKITGSLGQFGGAVSRPELISCLSFGDIGLTSLENCFYGCSNLTYVPSDIPSTVTSLQGCFRGASKFNQNISWNTQSIQDFSYCFREATLFNKPLAWNTTSATSMVGMFYSAQSFNQDISQFNVESVTAMDDMFYGAGLSTFYYDALLIAWAQQDVVSSVTFDAGDSVSSDAALEAKNILAGNPNNWIILDGNWTPLELSPVLWLDAADTSTITAMGGSVSQWDDKSGNALHVSQGTAASQPTTGASTLNGHNVIDFAGDFLAASTASDWTFMHDGTVWTALLAVKPGAVANPNAIYTLLGTGGGFDSALIGAALAYDDRASASRTDAVYAAVSTGVVAAWPILGAANNALPGGQASLLRVQFAPAEAAAADRLAVVVDGTDYADDNTRTFSPVTTAPSEPLNVGAVKANGAQATTGEIAEIIIVPRALTAAETSTAESYLAAKWGI